MVKIKSLDLLESLARDEGGVEVSLMLNYGLRSSKHIECDDYGKFWVMHYIDGSDELMTREQLKQSIIGEAITKGALILSE